MVTNPHGFRGGIEVNPLSSSAGSLAALEEMGQKRREGSAFERSDASRRPSTPTPTPTACEGDAGCPASIGSHLSPSPGEPPTAPDPRERRLPGTGCPSCRPSPQSPREAPLAPTCSPASRWRQHLAMLLQLPRARASLTALASLPRCQSAVPVQGHREPRSGGVCSWRAGE